MEMMRVPDASGEFMPSGPQRRTDDHYRKHLLDMIRLSDVSSKLTPSEPQLRFADEYGKRLMDKICLPDVNRESNGTILVEQTANRVSRPEVTSSSGDFTPRIVEFADIAGGRNVDLRDALNDLDEVTAEAREEDFPVPSDAALVNARRMLRALYKLSPQRFEVYPTPDGEVAIDAPGGRARSVVLLCDSDGGALCLVDMDGKHRRARYSETGSLPDGFVREALGERARRDKLAA